jgi:hypothetical protein
MTVQQLVNAALRTLGVIASGESPSTEESNDGLTALNGIIESWSALGMPIYQVTRETFSLTGAASYTIGTGQTWNTTRPQRIKSAAVVQSSVEQSVRVVSAEEWAGIVDQGRTGKFADVLYWDSAYPIGTMYLWPAPTTGGSLLLYSYKPLATFAALTDSVTLPPGYERALRFALAADLASEYGRTLTPESAAAAAESKAAITNLNQIVLGEAPAGATQ